MTASKHIQAYKALSADAQTAYNRYALGLLQAIKRRALLERFPDRSDNSIAPGKAKVWYLARFSASGAQYRCIRFGRMLILHYWNGGITFAERSRALSLVQERR